MLLYCYMKFSTLFVENRHYFQVQGYAKQSFAESLSGDYGFLHAVYPTHQPIFRAHSLERFPPYYLQSDLQTLPSLMVQDSKLCLWHIVRWYWAFFPRVTQWEVTVGRLDPPFTLSALLPFLVSNVLKCFLYIYFLDSFLMLWFSQFFLLTKSKNFSLF